MQDGTQINLDELTPEAFASLDDTQRMAILSGEMPAGTQEVAIQQQGDMTAQAQPTAEQIAAEQAASQQAQAAEQEQQQQDQRMVPLPALHQERQRRQQAEAVLQDPNALAQYLAQMGYQVVPQGQQEAPELAFEDPEVINAIVAQRLAPLEQELNAMRAERQQMAYRARIDTAVRDFGPDAEQLIAAFDEASPHQSGLDPYVKAATIHGLRWADPQYRQQQIDAQAQKIAEERLAASLAGSKKSPPVTLAGVTAATSNETPIAVDDMSFDDWSKLPADKREALLRGDTAFA